MANFGGSNQLEVLKMDEDRRAWSQRLLRSNPSAEFVDINAAYGQRAGRLIECGFELNFRPLGSPGVLAVLFFRPSDEIPKTAHQSVGGRGFFFHAIP